MKVSAVEQRAWEYMMGKPTDPTPAADPRLAEPGYVIWLAWRDGMLAQGREVAPERMSWETLDQRDRDLDAAIEAAVRNPAADPRLAELTEAALLREAASRAGVSITKGIQRDRHPDPEGLLVEALASMGYIVAPVGEALEEVIASSIALGAARTAITEAPQDFGSQIVTRGGLPRDFDERVASLSTTAEAEALAAEDWSWIEGLPPAHVLGRFDDGTWAVFTMDMERVIGSGVEPSDAIAAALAAAPEEA